MKESSYYPAIKKYYAKNVNNCAAIEVKITKTNRLPFRCLMTHQEEALLQAERVLASKEADVGMIKKNFDITVLYKATSILVAIYYIPRATEIYEIPIRAFLNEKYRSGKKSLTKDRAREIGNLIILSY